MSSAFLVLLLVSASHAMNVASATTTRSPFANKALTVVSNHRIVKSNPYCDWFQKGDASIEQAQDLVVQFSVFSNLFLLAQRATKPAHHHARTLPRAHPHHISLMRNAYVPLRQCVQSTR